MGFIRNAAINILASALTNLGWGRRASSAGFGAFSGEQTEGNMGPAIEPEFDYYDMRKRSWTQYLRNSHTLRAENKRALWLIGKGLQLHTKPKNKILEKFGITKSIEEFVEWGNEVEEAWELYAANKCSADNTMTLAQILHEVEKNTFLAGDVFYRFLPFTELDGEITPKIEIIDGGDVRTPVAPEMPPAGTYWIDGLELDLETNELIRFFVRQLDGTSVGVSVKNSAGQVVAGMVVGRRFRLRDARGLSRLAQNMEPTQTIDDYKCSIVESARAAADVFAVTEHDMNSSGSNIYQKAGLSAKHIALDGAQQPLGDDAAVVASKIRHNSKAVHLNLGPGQKFKVASGTIATSDAAAFYDAITNDNFSSMGVSPEVAKDKFDGSFSSAQMVARTTDFSLEVERELVVSTQFLKPLYRYWFELMVAQDIIDAPKYLLLPERGKRAYLNCEFTGKSVPAVKELEVIKTIREKLGPAYANVPLISLEKASMEASGQQPDYISKSILASMSNFAGAIPQTEKERIADKTSEADTKSETE
jgi:hypothetical protein